MTNKQREPVIPQLRKMLGKAAAGQSTMSRRRRPGPARVRLVAGVAVAGAVAIGAVSAGAFDRSPVAQQLSPEESGVKPGVVPGEVLTLEDPSGEKFTGEVSPCIKSDPAGYSSAELEDDEWCFHSPGEGGGGSAPGAPSPKASRDDSTDAIYVDPVDVAGHPVRDLQMTNGGTARSCIPGSDSVGKAYRCFAGHGVYDPCWRADADPSHPEVVCQARPWDRSVVFLSLGSGKLEPFDESGWALGGRAPWGVELMNGERCVAVQGAHEATDAGVVDYSCQSHSGGSEQLGLMRHIDQTGLRWKVASATYSQARGRYVQGPELPLAAVWYAAQE